MDYVPTIPGMIGVGEVGDWWAVAGHPSPLCIGREILGFACTACSSIVTFNGMNTVIWNRLRLAHLEQVKFS